MINTKDKLLIINNYEQNEAAINLFLKHRH